MIFFKKIIFICSIWIKIQTKTTCHIWLSCLANFFNLTTNSSVCLSDSLYLFLFLFFFLAIKFCKKLSAVKYITFILSFCFKIFLSVLFPSTWNSSAAAAKSLQSWPTLCDPIDGSPPGSPIPGIFQARTLEWVAISFSNAWKQKVKVKSLSRVRLSDAMDCSLPASSIRGIFQARVLECGAIAFSWNSPNLYLLEAIKTIKYPNFFSAKDLWGVLCYSKIPPKSHG